MSERPTASWGGRVSFAKVVRRTLRSAEVRESREGVDPAPERTWERLRQGSRVEFHLLPHSRHRATGRRLLSERVLAGAREVRLPGRDGLDRADLQASAVPVFD
jgi:hypothetical protein